MLPQGARFSRAAFPRSPIRRVNFPWGSVSIFTTPSFKAAVVVSKKVLRHATDRNRARRRVYSALEKTPHEPKGVVVFPRREALTAPHAQIVADLTAALK